MYRSKHDPKTPVTGSTFGIHGTTQLLGAGAIKKKDTATFGKPLNSQVADPAEFLRGGQKVQRVPARVDVTKFSFDSVVDKKSAVPRRTEKPVMGLQSSKNFVTANAIETILSEPRKMGGVPVQYAKRQGYGKVPKYLQTVKKQIAEEKEAVAATLAATHQQNTAQQGGMLVLPERERVTLLRQLKSKWASVNERYQTLPCVLDTPAKRARKEKYEDALSMLERDIDLLSKQTVIIAE